MKINPCLLLSGSLVFLLFKGVLFAQNSGTDFRKIENKAFKVGEKLTYDVKYGFVTAGVATMRIPEIKKITGRDTYKVLFEVNSVSSFDWFYKVRDRYETYIDVEGIFPWRFEQHIREGKYSRDFPPSSISEKEKQKLPADRMIFQNMSTILFQLFILHVLLIIQK
ncbi:MAG: DUF3108 domain-containing protein [Ignavibacteriaceae bacterium]|jgi:hypothetical protein